MERWKVIGMLALGMCLGVAAVRVVGSSEAEAQTGAYRDCFFAYQSSVSVDGHGVVPTPGENRLIHPPTGWTLAGAGGGPNGGYALFCR
jgi:hypothetical protein